MLVVSFEIGGRLLPIVALAKGVGIDMVVVLVYCSESLWKELDGVGFVSKFLRLLMKYSK